MKYNPGNFSDIFATPLGAPLWEFMNRDKNISMMEAASLLRRPAVEPLAWALLAEFGSEVAQDRLKQMIGHMARQVMEARGHRIVRQGVLMRRNPVFSSGSRYEKPTGLPRPGSDMRITREQRETWLRKTQFGEFNQWLDPQVRNLNGTLNLEKLHQVAREDKIDPTLYFHLNPGQQRMIIGIKLRAHRKKRQTPPW